MDINILRAKSLAVAAAVNDLNATLGGNWDELSTIIGMSSSAIPDMFTGVDWDGFVTEHGFKKLEGVYIFDSGIYPTAWATYANKGALRCVSNDFGGLKMYSWGAIDSVMGVAIDTVKALMKDDINVVYLRDGREYTQGNIIEIVTAQHGGK